MVDLSIGSLDGERTTTIVDARLERAAWAQTPSDHALAPGVVGAAATPALRRRHCYGHLSHGRGPTLN